MAKKWLKRALGMLALAALAGGACWFFGNVETRAYEMDGRPAANAVMGYALRADNTSQLDTKLRYVDVTWRELEPEEGKFDWEALEDKYHLSQLKNAGVHLVLRFVCDIPREEEHMDIPDWLYERTGDGTWYDTSYGRGYSPDYNNADFLTAHQRAIAALAGYFDGFASFVELGSLGHWGEWHVKYEDGVIPMPREKVRDQYVQHYLDAFSNAKLLMRRPFAIAAQKNLGLYNDMAGHEQATLDWLQWIENGGDYWQAQEEKALSAMPNAWQTAPIGGELTSSVSMKELLQNNLEDTLELIQASHMTFLGPQIADDTYQEGYQAVLGRLGYRLWIRQARLRPSIHGVQLSMIWRNDGMAPFYWDWPVYAYVLDENGAVQEARLVPLRLSTLLPGEETEVKVSLGSDGLGKKRRQRIAVGILDPMTSQNAVWLAMDAEKQNGMTLLFD